MRHSFLASVSLLCFLFSKASGVRLEKGFPLRSPQKQEGNALTRATSQVEFTGCRNGQCKGNNRKLSRTSISSTANTMSKKGGHQDEPLSLSKENITAADNEKTTSEANSSSLSDEYHEIVHENYHDLTDIAEMDYSPARRKPPIHN